MLKSKKGIVVPAVVFAGLFLVSAGVFADDAFEENDDAASATPLAELTEITANQADQDWYAINVPSGELRVIAALLFSHADGDIDIIVRHTDGLAFADGADSLTDNELVDVVLLSSGINYLQIKNGVAGGNKGNAYRLGWAAFADGSDDGNEPNNDSASARLLAEKTGVFGIKKDDDWYRIEVPAGSERIDIRLLYRTSPAFGGPSDGGDIDLELRDADGNLVASASTTSDHDYISQPNLAAGSYYIVVTGDNLNSGYYLEWDNIGVDDGSGGAPSPGDNSGGVSILLVVLFFMAGITRRIVTGATL